MSNVSIVCPPCVQLVHDVSIICPSCVHHVHHVSVINVHRVRRHILVSKTKKFDFSAFSGIIMFFVI